MVFLLRKIGEAKSKQLLLTGDLIDAEEAVSMRLINQIVPDDKLNDHVVSFATNLIESNSSNSMMLTKEMMATVHSMELSEALNYACKMNAEARASLDCKSGIEAFLKKQKMKW